MNTDDVIDKAAKVLYDHNHLTPTDWADAWVLAERLDAAGLLARPLPTRDEIADILNGWPIGTGHYANFVSIDEAQDIADEVLELLEGTKK